jgi:DNA-binding transcriptional regulator YiaG
MGKIEDALRDEVVSILQQELKSQLAPLMKELAELKRLLGQAPQRAVAAPPSVRPAPPTGLAVTDEESAKARLSPEIIRALRRRIGVSQSQLALIIGVTPGAVAQWELGMVKPQGRNRAVLVGLRRSSKQEAAKLLEERRAARGAGG